MLVMSRPRGITSLQVVFAGFFVSSVVTVALLTIENIVKIL